MKTIGTKCLLLGLACCLLLAGCGPKQPQPSDTPTDPPRPSPTETAVPTPAGTEVRLAVISGPTGVGAAKLLYDNETGVTTNRYDVTVCADNQQVTAGLTNGEFDIAALATNVASTLYHKSNGGVQLVAVNTLGTLYILNKGVDDTLNGLADLKGRTIHAFGQGANPEYVLDYLLAQNGLDPDKDVDIVWGAADEVTAAMLSGKGELCMLPVPAATALTAKSQGNIQPIFDLSEEWDALHNGSQLTMGCMVVRTAFAQEHPEAVEEFLREYKGSIEYMSEPGNLTDETEMGPAQLVERYGLVPSAAIAKEAIPQCNLTYIVGEEMRDAIQGYYEALYAADPAAIGGSIPDDAFYFLPGAE